MAVPRNYRCTQPVLGKTDSSQNLKIVSSIVSNLLGILNFIYALIEIGFGSLLVEPF